MAITTTDWLTVDGDVSGNGVKHQCKITYDNVGTNASTPAFNWAVMGDFTVILENRDTNSDLLDAEDDVDVWFEASVDGINYFLIYEEENVLGDGDNTGFHVYDFDSKGLFPHMRITLDPDGTIGNPDIHNIFVTVVPHHMV